MEAVEPIADLLDLTQERCLVWAGLILSPAKTSFFIDKTRMFGHECALTGVRPSADKLSAIANWPTPDGEADVMRPGLHFAVPEDIHSRPCGPSSHHQGIDHLNWDWEKLAGCGIPMGTQPRPSIGVNQGMSRYL